MRYLFKRIDSRFPNYHFNLKLRWPRSYKRFSADGGEICFLLRSKCSYLITVQVQTAEGVEVLGISVWSWMEGWAMAWHAKGWIGSHLSFFLSSFLLWCLQHSSVRTHLKTTRLGRSLRSSGKIWSLSCSDGATGYMGLSFGLVVGFKLSDNGICTVETLSCY